MIAQMAEVWGSLDLITAHQRAPQLFWNSFWITAIIRRLQSPATVRPLGDGPASLSKRPHYNIGAFAEGTHWVGTGYYGTPIAAFE